MRCDEVQEHLIDIIYDEGVDSPVNVEMQEHLRTCSTCRGELEELKQTRKYLQLWKDEPPLRTVKTELRSVPHREHKWKYLRYAAVAALVLISFMALANMRISWDKNGFSLSTHLFPQQNTQRDYYSKAELRTLLKQVVDDSEFRMNEANLAMANRLLDTIEQDQWIYASRNQNKN